MVRPRHSNVVPGQHIYAYCNVKTKQVLYSLTRTLQHKQLQQLPDTGANNNPPTLRKDLWRPLWTLQLPDGEDGVAQGIQAYKMLRDFRVLHETNWEPPKSMSVPYTEEQIKKLEKRLDGRGGSKKESAHDLIARKKWKMRVQMVMDQKTNSIADLAAVLLKQEERIGKQLAARNAARRAEIAEMEELAELWVADGGAARKELEGQIEEWTKMRDARQEDRRWRKLNGKVDAAQLRLAKMEFAAEWVPRARQEAEAAREEEKERRIRARAEAKAAAAKAKAEAEAENNAQTGQGSTSTSTSTPAVEEAVEEEEEMEIIPEDFSPWTTHLPNFPSHLTREPLTASKTRINLTPKRHIPPVFSLQGEGVTVRWANTLDAEYAAEWPALVRHEPMGIVRNTAPRADDETPVLDAAEFKALGWKSRKEGFSLEPTLAEKVQERRKAMGLVEHPTLKNKFTKGVSFHDGDGNITETFQPVDSDAQRAVRKEELERLERKALRSVRGTSPRHSLAMGGAGVIDQGIVDGAGSEARV